MVCCVPRSGAVGSTPIDRANRNPNMARISFFRLRARSVCAAWRPRSPQASARARRSRSPRARPNDGGAHQAQNSICARCFRQLRNTRCPRRGSRPNSAATSARRPRVGRDLASPDGDRPRMQPVDRYALRPGLPGPTPAPSLFAPLRRRATGLSPTRFTFGARCSTAGHGDRSRHAHSLSPVTGLQWTTFVARYAPDGRRSRSPSRDRAPERL